MYISLAPSVGPLLTKAVNTSSTSIALAWEAIAPEHHQGILLGHRICYRAANTGRKRVCLDVDVNTFQLDLADLFLWWPYDIQVGGFTRKGVGVMTNVTVQTDEARK